jgi:hypothetical protein
MIVIPWFSYFWKQSLSRSNIWALDRIKSFISHQVLWNGKCIVSADHHINYCSLNCEWIIRPFISLTIDSQAYHHDIWNFRTFSPIIIRNQINYSLIIITIHQTWIVLHLSFIQYKYPSIKFNAFHGSYGFESRKIILFIQNLSINIWEFLPEKWLNKSWSIFYKLETKSILW